MIDLHSRADLDLLRESIDLECKLAVGRDGQGALPHDFWPTYSAFANTQGGVVLLGVREKKGQFQLEGSANPAQVNGLAGVASPRSDKELSEYVGYWASQAYVWSTSENFDGSSAYLASSSTHLTR